MSGILYVLGRQAAQVTQLMVTKAYLKTSRGVQAASKEVQNMLGNQVWLSPQELESIPTTARVVKGKLLISEKNWEMPQALHECISRFVGMGNILFDKRMRVLRCSSDSLWAPVASLAGDRFVQARSLPMGRETETIDLLSA